MPSHTPLKNTSWASSTIESESRSPPVFFGGSNITSPEKRHLSRLQQHGEMVSDAEESNDDNSRDEDTVAMLLGATPSRVFGTEMHPNISSSVSTPSSTPVSTPSQGRKRPSIGRCSPVVEIHRFRPSPTSAKRPRHSVALIDFSSKPSEDKISTPGRKTRRSSAPQSTRRGTSKNLLDMDSDEQLACSTSVSNKQHSQSSIETLDSHMAPNLSHSLSENQSSTFANTASNASTDVNSHINNSIENHVNTNSVSPSHGLNTKSLSNDSPVYSSSDDGKIIKDKANPSPKKFAPTILPVEELSENIVPLSSVTPATPSANSNQQDSNLHTNTVDDSPFPSAIASNIGSIFTHSDHSDNTNDFTITNLAASTNVIPEKRTRDDTQTEWPLSPQKQSSQPPPESPLKALLGDTPFPSEKDSLQPVSPIKALGRLRQLSATSLASPRRNSRQPSVSSVSSVSSVPGKSALSSSLSSSTSRLPTLKRALDEESNKMSKSKSMIPSLIKQERDVKEEIKSESGSSKKKGLPSPNEMQRTASLLFGTKDDNAKPASKPLVTQRQRRTGRTRVKNEEDTQPDSLSIDDDAFIKGKVTDSNSKDKAGEVKPTRGRSRESVSRNISASSANSEPQRELSITELRQLTTKNTQRNKRVHNKLNTVVIHKDIPRPPSPSSHFRKSSTTKEKESSSRKREDRADRVKKRQALRDSLGGIVVKDEPSSARESLATPPRNKHYLGAGDQEIYVSPSKKQEVSAGSEDEREAKMVKWDKALIVEPEMIRRASQDDKSKAILKDRPTLDAFGNVLNAKLPLTPIVKRTTIEVSRVIYADDGEEDEDSEDEDDDYDE